jgi:PAS domain S-box-containing protein
MAAPDVTPGDRRREPSQSATRDEEAIYRLVAENAEELIRLNDLTGRCLYASPSVERLFGRVPSELFETAHPGDVDACRRWWNLVVAGESEHLRWRVRDASGNYRRLETSPKLVRYRERPHVMTVCRDISEQERAAEREDEFRKLAESSPGMMGVYHRRVDGSARILYASPRIWDLYGVRPEDVVDDAAPVLARTHPDDRARLRESITESARTMTPWRLEYRVLHPIRGELWLEGYSNPFPHPDGGIVWYGYIHEITDRKRAEEAARASEERLRLTFEAANIGTGDMDLRARRVDLSNPMRRVLGLPPGTCNITFDEYVARVHPEDREGVRREVASSIAGQPTISLDYRIVWPDGSIHWVTSRARTFYDESGKATRILGAIMDVTERKLSEERLRLTFEAARIGTGEMDLRTHQISLSGALQRVLGVAPDTSSITFDDYVELIHPEDRESVRGVVESAKAGRPEIAIDYRVVWPDGSVHFTTSRAKVFFDAAGTATRVVAALMDITERQRVEEEVRRQKEVLQKVVDNAPLAITFFDENGRLLLVNRAWERLFGWTLKELSELKLEVYAKLLPDPRERERALRFMAAGTGEWEEFRVCTKGGAAMDVLLSTIRLSDGTTIARLQDVTERLRADAALRRSEELLRRAEAMARLASFTFNVADGTLLTSEQGNRLFKWTPAPHRMDDLLAFVHPEDRPRLEAALEGALGGAPFEMEHRIVVGGKVKWVHARVEPQKDDHGRVTGLIGASQDVTARRRLEEQFRQAQKMEAIGTLAGGVAHDFNNLLTVISGYSDLLMRDLATGDPMREPVVEIHRAGARARALIRQLLAFSRQQVLEPKVLDLNAVVTEMEKMLRRLIGEDIELVVALDPELARVKADPGQLEQVLVNLSVNARDAMPRGGRLAIETRNVTLDPSFAATAGVPAGEYVLLTVSDNGVGMDSRTKGRVFEPFFTTKEPGKGSGLGMAIVHGVVAQSGGHVEVESELGHGATFKIHLPAATERVSTGKLVSGPRAPARGRETILLVEDEASVRKLARNILASYGYAILEAANGQDALRVAADHQGPIDLLLSDVVMPHLGGPQLAKQLRAGRPDLKVLFMSGYADAGVLRQGGVETEHAFLQKPFTPAALAQTVRDILDRAPATLERA